MDIYVSVLYTQRFRRTRWFGLAGKKRQELELVGISISDDNKNVSLFNSDYTMRTIDEYNDAAIFTMLPPAVHPQWMTYDAIISEVGAFLGLDCQCGCLNIITNGDPHQETLIAKLLAEAQCDLTPVAYHSTGQLLDHAARWLPLEAYGPGSNFTTQIMVPEGHEPSLADRKRMFVSHLGYPIEESEYHLRARAENLRRIYLGTDLIIRQELLRYWHEIKTEGNHEPEPDTAN